MLRRVTGAITVIWRPAMPKKTNHSGQQPRNDRDYRLETYFVGGKMKHRRIPLIEGHAVDEFLRANADDTFLAAEGHFELLHERECERNQADAPPLHEDDNGMIPF